MDGTERRRRLLHELYGPAEADRTAARLERLLADQPAPALTRPRWSERDAWLIAYPDHVRVAGEPGLVTLRRFVTERLPAGLTGVHVLPVHPWTSDGGFAVADYERLADGLGGWAAFAALAADRRVMADAVVNHTSASHPWFAGFLAGDPGRTGWYRLAEGDVTTVTRPRPGSPVVEHGGRAVWCTFGADQPDLDYRTPDVLLAMVDVVLRYVRQGAGAIRLDAVAYLWKEEGTSSIHGPGTHAVVRLLRACLDEVAPAAVLVTETNVPDAENLSYLGETGAPEAHAAYEFALPPLVLHALRRGDAAALTAWAGGRPRRPEGTTTLTFLASHDGIGLRPADGLLTPDDVAALAADTERAGGAVNHYAGPDGTLRPYELAGTWWSLLAEGVDEATARARHVAGHAIAFALPGIPLVYLHSLLGAENDTAAFERSGAARDLNRARVAPEAADTPRAHSLIGQLGALLDRRRDPAFHPEAPAEVLDLGTERFGVRRRRPDGGAATVVVEVVPPYRVDWETTT
jgi:glucosylglycerate phosphorylase